MQTSHNVIVLATSIFLLTSCGQEIAEFTLPPTPTVTQTKEPSLTEKTIQDLIEGYNAKNMLTGADLKYTFQLNDALVGKKIVTRAWLYDITQKDVKTYFLHLQQNGSILWPMRLQSPTNYYQLEYPADKVPALLEMLDLGNDTFGIAAEITSVHPMKLDIIGNIEDKDTGAVTIEGNPARLKLMRGVALELAPVLSDEDEWQEELDRLLK